MKKKVERMESGLQLMLNFKKIGSIAKIKDDFMPLAVQDFDSGLVLLVAYTNREAYEASRKKRLLTLWSTSRNELWIKGEKSGQTFEIVKMFVNCEQNSLLYQVRPKKTPGICHTKNRSGRYRNTCFYREIDLKTGKLINHEL